MKQEALASLLFISQQAISKIESSSEVSDQLLEKIADALQISKDVIRNFNENTLALNGGAVQDPSVSNSGFNPMEKVVELYERLLKTEREKNEVLITALQKISSINKK